MYQPSRPQRTATWDPTGLDIHVLTNGRALTPTMLYSDPAALGWLAFSILEYFIGGKVTWRHDIGHKALCPMSGTRSASGAHSEG